MVPSLLDIVDLAGTPFFRITVEEEEKKTNVLRVMGQKKCNPSGVRYAQQGHPESFQRVEAGGKPDSGIFKIIQIYSSFFFSFERRHIPCELLHLHQKIV